ncbi:MAG: hypothetical protein AAAC47_01415, partial [Pararhizobium sp.]
MFPPVFSPIAACARLENVRKPLDLKIRTAIPFFPFFVLSAATEVVMFYQPVKLSVSSKSNATADRKAIEKTRWPRFDRREQGNAHTTCLPQEMRRAAMVAAPGENMRVNADRLWDSLMEMAKIGPG